MLDPYIGEFFDGRLSTSSRLAYLGGASHAAMAKEILPMIGRLLGHANHQSTARYAHLDDEHLLDVAQQVGNVVERLIANIG